MLGMLFRGVFLIGILSWYSTNVWKLIDGYFRDQFRNYLEEEYRKNPRMRSDLQTASVGKDDPATVMPETTVAPSREILEACESAVCPVEIAGNDTGREEVTGGTSENEAESGSTDKNAYLGTTAESQLESRKSFEADQESRLGVNRDDHDLQHGELNDDRRSSPSPVKKKRSKTNTKSVTPRDIARGPATPKKQTVKTITLTERDFDSVVDTSNDDFWEFEEDADERGPIEGILVSQLPFKPKIDGIGYLERVTADEYCPLTLEDEPNCGDTVKWP
ncbi:uncharacterized protein LOC117226014 [Megalopta genalis]|uniref:uncharacterized protein LOC117226014 n=1 Tax=Megalopta genalis TaxID=115081 RepID=UPI001442F50F|nr:uncharacterized protein LOC117226014 [Megalopta genalis]